MNLCRHCTWSDNLMKKYENDTSTVCMLKCKLVKKDDNCDCYEEVKNGTKNVSN